MKKIIVGMLVLVFANLSGAQPLTLEQSQNVLKTYQLEFGIDAHYSYDNWTVIGASSVEYTKKDITISAVGRYATDDQTELVFSVPYKFLSGTTTGIPGDSVSGLGVMMIGGKYYVIPESNFPSLAMGFYLDLPTGDPKKVLQENAFEGGNLGRGLNLGASIILTKKLFGPINLNINGMAKYRGKYTGVNDAEILLAPLYSAGAEIELGLGNLALVAEAYATTFNKYKVAGVEQDSTAGNTFNTVYGARLNLGNLKIKAGIDLSMGGATFREYNYKIFGGVGMLFDGAGK